MSISEMMTTAVGQLCGPNAAAASAASAATAAAAESREGVR